MLNLILEYALTFFTIAFALTFLVFIHELGHFLMAKKAGIRVDEFAIGFPPRLWKKKKGETTYSFNLIPLGGYVKLFGEDASDPKILKNKRSFASKSIPQRIGVIIGGVVMNFIAAFIIFTIGFTIGMKPMLPNPSHIENGVIEIQQGEFVQSINSEIPSKSPINIGDQIVSINKQPIKDSKFLLSQAQKNNILQTDLTIGFIQNKEAKTFTYAKGSSLNFQLFPSENVSRIQIEKISPQSRLYLSGLKQKDVITKINDQQINLIDQFNQQNNQELKSITFLRNTQEKTVSITESPTTSQHTLKLPEFINRVTLVKPNQPAALAGLKAGDTIYSINGTPTPTSQKVITELQNNYQQKQTQIDLKIYRDNQASTIKAKLNDQGKLGFGISDLQLSNDQQLILSATYSPLSITNINDLQYPLPQASLESLKLMKELSYLTATGTVKAITSIFTNLEVPQELGGIVAISNVMHQKIKDGFSDVIQTIGFLSLMLAVINILPIPALDGGRLLFIIIEALIGKRIKPQWEAYIHAFGFLLLLTLIILVTYKDIINLL